MVIKYSPRFSRFPTKFGSYWVERLIGRGGMGEVYRAFRLELKPVVTVDGRVALKVPHNPCRSRTLQAIEDEWTIGSRCRHPNIVKMHEWGCVNGVPFIVMELVNGMSVERLLRQAAVRMGAEAAIAIALQVCEALECVHGARTAEGVPMRTVYQDLKPGNLLLGRDGHVTLVDFGLARFRNSLVGVEPGTVRGTPSYTAPEQVQGMRTDRRTDVFLIGTLLCELVTHRPAFMEDSVSQTLLAVKACMEPVARAERRQQVEAVCPHLWEVVDICHQAQRKDRPRDMRAVHTLLQSAHKQIGGADPRVALRAWVASVMDDLCTDDDDENAA